MVNYHNSNESNNKITSINTNSQTNTSTLSNNINLSFNVKKKNNLSDSLTFNSNLSNSNNSADYCDMTSLEILNKCHLDLFPKKEMICDDLACKNIVEQLPILNGEYVHFIGNFCLFEKLLPI